MGKVVMRITILRELSESTLQLKIFKILYLAQKEVEIV